MNGVELRYQQGRMGLPFGGFSGNVDFIDEAAPAGGVPMAPWTNLSTGSSSAAFHKVLAEIAFAQQLKSEQALPSASCPPLHSPLSRFTDRHLNPISYPVDAWAQQLQAGYAVSNTNDLKDAVRHYPQHIALNGGSLVLDTARGELVNASKMTPKEILEAKALAASKSHSEAERRRRERINSHLATLRTLLPSSTKTDKASLLAEVIDQVKVLKRQVSEIYEFGPMPTDVDELRVEKDAASGDGRLMIKASLCCDDRPDLMSDLSRALDTLRLRTVKAEISTLGGRVKNVFVMTLKEDPSEQDQGGPSVNCVQEALRQVMERPGGGGEASPGTSTKRQRLGSFDAASCAS